MAGNERIKARQSLASDINASPQRGAGAWRGLPARLLVLTVGFVMLAEVLIFLPSVANFRNVWLQSHLDTAEAASIVYLDTADPMLSEKAQAELLAATRAQAVVIREGAASRLMASSPMAGPVAEHIDLTVMQPFATIRSALALLVSAENTTYRVFAPMKSREATMELVQSNEFLRGAVRTYARNVALISLAISLITAGLVYLALFFLIVRPIRRLSANMVAFAREPDNRELLLQPSRRADEIGVVERQLADFESDLHSTLRQRQRLADLGLAVSKINHDLRNILASAQLFSDRLADVRDPLVQRLLPKLVKTIDRATEYSQSVLAYGTAEESKPRRRRHRLRLVVEEVHDLLDFGSANPVEWRNEVSEAIEAEIDLEQMVRAILNLCRNALQAMQRDEAGESGINRLTISAEEKDGANAPRIIMRVADTGPGIEETVRHDLFRPFKKSASRGGAGLGLVIAAEILRAHGGAIEVERSSEAGTVFRLEFQAQAN